MTHQHDSASLRLGLLAVALAGLALPAAAQQAPVRADADALARAAQNPVANMISLPFQNNTNLQYGPRDHTQNVLNIQPVIPFALNADWNIITRTIVPVMSQPGLSPGEGTTFGLGGTVATAFLSPARPMNGIIWGAGPVVQAPTTTDRALGSNQWGVGPSAVALTMNGPWVVGALINNIWSTGGSGRNSYNMMTLQPFVNYNFHGGTYLSTAPIITSNWEARSGQRWTVPVGGAVGQIFRIGEQPVNAQLGAYYNAVHPDLGPTWQIRAQVQFLFPK